MKDAHRHGHSCSLIDNLGGIATKEIIVGLVTRTPDAVREIQLVGGTGSLYI